MAPTTRSKSLEIHLPAPPDSWHRDGGGKKSLFAASSDESTQMPAALRGRSADPSSSTKKLARENSFDSESAVRRPVDRVDRVPQRHDGDDDEYERKPQRRNDPLDDYDRKCKRPQDDDDYARKAQRRRQQDRSTSEQPARRLRSKSPAPLSPRAVARSGEGVHSIEKRRRAMSTVACNVCHAPVLPHQRYRGFLCCHEECGLATKSAQQGVSRDPLVIHSTFTNC